MKGFKSVKAFINGEFIVTNIGFVDDVISYIGDDDSVITEEIKVDGIVCPGFIDEHIHGAAGMDAMDADVKSLDKFAKTLVEEGVTSFAPTTITNDADKTVLALKKMKEYSLKENDGGARVIAVHLEGPFIDHAKCGAQPPEYILKPDKDIFDRFLEAGGGLVKIISLAPEVDGALEFISYITGKGVTVSAGHTSATFEEFKEGVKAGVTCTTHTFNAMSGFTHREVGVVGGAMLTDVYNEIIADGIHVSFEAIKVLASLKADKLILITDSLSAKKEGVGKYVSNLAGIKVYVDGLEARIASGNLAGSVLPMDCALKNMVEKVGLPLEKVINAATANPAKNLKVFDKVGSIEVGKKADFAVLSEDLSVKMTVIDGKIVYLA